MIEYIRAVSYKGYTIYQTNFAWWEVRIDGKFMKFDSLSYAKSRIDYWTK